MACIYYVKERQRCDICDACERIKKFDKCEDLDPDDCCGCLEDCPLCRKEKEGEK